MYGANIPTSVPKVSNRMRQRIAVAAIQQANREHLILLGVLAQKGGEVIVTDWTIKQVEKALKAGDMDYAVLDGKAKGEHIIRIVQGKNNDGDQAVAKEAA